MLVRDGYSDATSLIAGYAVALVPDPDVHWGEGTGRVVPETLRVCSRRMERPTKFEEFRYVGDKRTQRFYDLDDDATDPAVIDELMASEKFASFGGGIGSEARNRGYRAG
jgi:hypothetical protein